MKSLLPFIAISVIFTHCTSVAEQYAKRPRVKRIWTQTFWLGDLSFQEKKFKYADNGLLSEMETRTGKSPDLKDATINTCYYTYNKDMNVEEIKRNDGNHSSIEKFIYSAGKLIFRITQTDQKKDTIAYTYDGDLVTCTTPFKEFVSKGFFTQGNLDSTYLYKGKYIIGKEFYTYSDTVDYTIVPVPMGKDLINPCKAVTRYNRRYVGDVAQHTYTYEYDGQQRQTKIEMKNCNDFVASKIEYH